MKTHGNIHMCMALGGITEKKEENYIYLILFNYCQVYVIQNSFHDLLHNPWAMYTVSIVHTVF